MAYRRTTGGNRGADGRQTGRRRQDAEAEGDGSDHRRGEPPESARRPGRPAPIAVVRRVAVDGVTSAAANSAAVAKRSAGSFCERRQHRILDRGRDAPALRP